MLFRVHLISFLIHTQPGFCPFLSTETVLTSIWPKTRLWVHYHPSPKQLLTHAAPWNLAFPWLTSVIPAPIAFSALPCRSSAGTITTIHIIQTYNVSFVLYSTISSASFRRRKGQYGNISKMRFWSTSLCKFSKSVCAPVGAQILMIKKNGSACWKYFQGSVIILRSLPPASFLLIN